MPTRAPGKSRRCNLEDLGVVWGDDEDVVESWRFASFSIDPGGVRGEEVADQTANDLRLLGDLIAGVRDRQIAQACSVQRTC